MQLFQNHKLLTVICAKAPQPLRRSLICVIASIFFAFDTDRCRSSVWSSIKQVFPSTSWWGRLQIALHATRTSFHYCVVTCDLGMQPGYVIEKKYKQKTIMEGAEELTAALSLGRGAILASSHFSCFYIALFADARNLAINTELQTMVVAQPPLGDSEEKFFRKLQTLATTHLLERIELWKPRSGLDFLGAVRARKIVACMIDNVNHESPAVFCEFLGERTAFPAGLYAIAAKCDTPILPVHVEWSADTNRFRVVFGKAIVTDPSASLDVRISAGAQAVAEYFSKVIFDSPSSWESWRTLAYRRFSYAKE
ncbi:MAG: hypothetical protein ACRCWJ_18645 [Casimicrobium sp.]